MIGWLRWKAALAAVVVVLLAAGCSGTASSGTPGNKAAASTDPRATSLDTPDGAWATTAMGDPTDPLNTFWQLFHRPAGSTDWTDAVKATATATNGGLALAAGGERIVVGVRPSQGLTFSPLIASSDGGKTWQNGVLPAGLIDRTDAIAANAGGGTLALIRRGSAAELVQSPAGLTGWYQVATLASLAGSAMTAACGVTAFDAVAYSGTTPVLGTSCARKGTAGIFVYTGGGSTGAWEAVGPSLPGSSVTVLALRDTGSGIGALLEAAGPDGAALVAAWSADGGRTWQTSPAQGLAGSNSLDSVGPAGATGFFALFTAPAGVLQLGTIAGPGRDWTALPAPPPATQTAVFATDSAGPQLLAGNRTVMTVWNLGSGSWVKGQDLPVQISFGSSG
jgi:hypothetical protein